MGINAVSSLQYKLDDLEEALVKVHLSSACKTPDEDSLSEETSLRKRKNANTTDTHDDTSDLSSDLSLNDSFTKKTGSPEKYKDALKWFGVLVPQPLRQSQKKFQTAAELCCHLASLKMKHLQLQQSFKDLKKMKENVLKQHS